MLLCEVYRPQTNKVETLAAEEVAGALAVPQQVLWLDLKSPTKSELDWLAETFHFHPLAMEDVHEQRERAKVDAYDSYFFFVLRAIEYHPRSHRVDSHEIDIFLGPNYLVTIHNQAIPALEASHRRWHEPPMHQETAAFLFYTVVDAVVDHVFPDVDQIGDAIDEIDTNVLQKPDPIMVQTIIRLRRGLLIARKHISSLRDVLNELLRSDEEGSLFAGPGALRAYFNDIYDHVLRLTDFIDTYRDMLSGSMEAYQSALANRLNTNMQRLTVAATILATATVVTGFFGMNLQGLMINSPWRYGGLSVLIVLVVVTVIEIWLFHRRGWI